MGRSALDRINNFTDFTRKTDSYTVAQGGSYQKHLTTDMNGILISCSTFNKSLTEKYHWISMVVVILELPYLIRYQELVNFNVENIFALGNTDPRPAESFW
ncbi:MAG: hypothetical protein IPI77_17735 [Saprospiraceae bacterium]|nr:hypothetical protein [Saprospiraceae bacterium]